MKLLLVVVAACLITTAFAQMISPTPGTTWKVKQKANVVMKKGRSGETVDIFFNSDRTAALAGGPIDGGDTTFSITVPIRALSPPYGGTSDLLAVHRIDQNLTSVDNVPIHVVW